MPSVKKNNPTQTLGSPPGEGVGGKFGREYWRSLNEFADSPEFQTYVENEFPSQLEQVITPSNRRTFLKLMGASLALAGAGLPGCRRWPNSRIAPFSHRPENYVPGEPLEFATSMELGGYGQGFLVKSYDGRPIKVEGNEKHPINGGRVAFLPGADPMPVGSTDSFAQASILEFYDPERSHGPITRANPDDAREEAFLETPEALREFINGHFAPLRSSAGAGLAILHEATSSPTFADVKDRLSYAMPEARWHEWEPVSRDNEIAGAAIAFGGTAHRAQYDLTRADVVVALDSDFLHAHPAAIKHSRDFAARRRHPGAGMSRLYAAEGTLSITGANADHRVAVKSRDIAAVAGLIAKKLDGHGVSVLGAGQLGNVSGGGWNEFCAAVAADLARVREEGGHGLVIAGPRQPAEVHALVHAINFALGSVGHAVNFTQEPGQRRVPHLESIRTLADNCRNGRVQTLLIIGGNPVYDAPGDVRFAEAIGHVGMRIHLSVSDNETSQRCHWHVNRAHPLESWGDTRAWDGTMAPTQPLIDPLYGGRTAIELLALIGGEEVTDGNELVRAYFQGASGASDFESSWRTMLHDGVRSGSAWRIENESLRLQAGEWTARLQRLIDLAAGDRGTEVIFIEDASVYDGRFANNGWLQELPDPIAKISWDNAAYMSPATADGLGVKGDDLILIDFPGSGADEDPLEIAAHIVPGHADDTISLNLGYGRWRAGHLGTGVGFDVNPWRKTSGMNFVSGVAVNGTRRRYKLATVQDHHAMDTRVGRNYVEKRGLAVVQEARLDRFEKEGGAAFFEPGHEPHHPPVVSLWESHQFDGALHKWGMSIDLNACNGCSACITACQAENNIPIVGKDQVARGREMHWIRVDRYYKGRDTANPEIAFQPVACQHCENAPCEQVCPVAATLHDREGLNVMVYNRCVGTRYCSNNCPYKVRRFNFYDWHVEDPRVDGLKPPTFDIPDRAHERAFTGGNESLRMAFNPEVTVRSRGVMEKCSFCVQRINRQKIKTKNAWALLPEDEKAVAKPNDIPDGVITPACAQACPAQAIIFGDLKDPNSRVAKLRDDARAYALLEDLNTRPRTRFLGKVRNYNTSLKPAQSHAGESADAPNEGFVEGSGDDH